MLVLSIPKASDGRRGGIASFRLEALEPTRGRWVGRPPGDPQAP